MTLFRTPWWQRVVALLSIFVGWQSCPATAADVCSMGTGIPPFLSSGADPNLLLVIDNSGSMLDMAYKNTAQNTQCFDATYSSIQSYAGYFEENDWYIWEGGAQPWNDPVKNTIADPWVAPWKHGESYSAGEIVYANGGLYKAASSGTANDPKPENGYNLAEDGYNSVTNTGVDWDPVSQATIVSSLPGTCANGDLAAYSNKVFVCKDNQWSKLEGGQFRKVSQAEALGACTAASGISYSNSDVCVKVIEETMTIQGKTLTVQKAMNAFVARGNFLNWASASKLDVQKKILTGGKYDATAQQLVGESRGCAGYGFVKQVDVGSKKLVLRVRGATNEDRVGAAIAAASTDDTTRIEVVGLSTSGFDQGLCQDVIDRLNSGNITQNQIDQCLSATNETGASQAALSTSVNVCRQLKDDDGDGVIEPSEVPNLSGTVAAKCQDLFTNYGYSPPTMTASDGGYVCSGIYDAGITDANREGYLGRCWMMPITGCNPKPEVSNSNGGCDRGTNVRCQYCAGGTDTTSKCSTSAIFKNEGGYNWQCSDVKGNAAQGYYCHSASSATDWALQYVDNNNNSCVPGTVSEGAWASEATCLPQAMLDFCGSLKVPEVIDPSDQATTSSEYWNVPAMLIDGGVLGQMGVAKPLAVMKGYVNYVIPSEQLDQASGRPTGPRGVLYDVAGTLRIGAMAFNDNGAATECSGVAVGSSIEKYCPSTNKDGAKVVAQIQKNMYVDDHGTPDNYMDDTEVWTNYTHLVQAINGIRATSWTPLAEALYNALGYYGQKSDRRLDANDFKIATDATSWTDPVQYWCQSNHILIITEGASTADINQQVVNFATTLNPNDGDTEIGTCANGLDGSTYLDDLTWFGQHATVAGDTAGASSLFATLIATNKDAPRFEKQPIATHIVSTGSLRTDGTGECSPKTLMENAANNGGTTLYQGENPAQLEANLKAALSDILSRASAGSAASVISSSRSGEGGVYQAIFWPKMDRGVGKAPLLWAGDVHAFFIDDNGLLWDDHDHNGTLSSEDKDGNGLLDPGEDANSNGSLDGDRRVITYYDTTTNTTRICHNPSVVTTGICASSQYANTTYTSVDLRDFDGYLWSANDRLKDVDVSVNRGTDSTTGRWDFSTNQRYIFTWNDLNNDGIVDYDNDDLSKSEVRSLATQGDGAITSGLDSITTPAGRKGVLNDFNVTSDQELGRLITWLRGDDIYERAVDGTFTPHDPNEDINDNGVQDWAYRCRKFPSCDSTEAKVWRLGDIIHSTPTLVSRPAEGYHLVYHDPEYARFYKKYLPRRHMLYFGGNDGMLHAVNAGFYDVGSNRFLPCRPDQRDANGNCPGTPYVNGYPALGDELWAYVPYNLQPHLGCLTDPEYKHKYFVDAPPRIFDVRIFEDDSVHPGGWGTILVGYMRFGGSPTPAGVGDPRTFVSAYFVLDVTDPERPPTLLAEMTMTGTTIDHDNDPATPAIDYTDLGYTTSMPSVVAMRDDTGKSEWYLVLGNGPTTVKGENTQPGKIAVIPMSYFTGVNWRTTTDGGTDGIYSAGARKAFRIPNIAPENHAVLPYAGVYPISNGPSFVGDIVTVDYDIGGSGVSGIGKPYKTDAVYFGTVDGSGFAAPIATPDITYWNGGGRMFRLVTNVLASGVEQYSHPSDWYLRELLDAKAPITAAPNIGYDGDNFWVYFGTGRFFAPEDKADQTQQYFFGLKEPRNSSCGYTWNAIYWWNSAPITPNPAAAAGSRGLFRADPIHVVESSTLNGVTNYVYCDGAADCSVFPSGLSPFYTEGTRQYYSFDALERYIVGERCGTANNDAIGIDGWYRKLNDPRERSLGMPTLLGGLTTFATYQPSADLCTAEGYSYLYGVYFLTGTAWYEDVFGTYTKNNKEIVKDRLSLGKGLATTPSLQSGAGTDDAKAFVQTSTGEIVEIGQKNLPISESSHSQRSSWSER